MLKHNVLAIFCLFFTLGAAAQTAPKTLKGRVSDGTAPLTYVSVSLATPADSTVVLAGNFVEGTFEFDNLADTAYNVTFSSMGYAPKTVPVQLTDAVTDMGEITLQADAQQLAAVSVTAHRPLFQQKEGTLIVNVDHTILSDAGSLTDLLKRSPGLMVSGKDNSIQVFGKGTPVIYIDNREVVAQAQLDALQSTDIDRIEIDRNPSAKYSAAGHAVVRIYTKHGLADHADVMLYDNLTFGRKISNTVGTQLDFKKGKWANLLSYSFWNGNRKDYQPSYTINTQPDYTIRNIQDNVNYNSYESHSIFSGNQYNIDDRNRLGLQFSGIWTSPWINSLTRQTIQKTGSPDLPRQIDEHRSSYSPLYNVNLSYQFQPDSVNTFSAVVAYAHTTNPDTQDITETDLTNNTLTRSAIQNNSINDIYSAQADGGFRLLKFIDISLGAKYSQVVTDGNTLQMTASDASAEQSRIDDRIAVGYFEFSKHIGAFDINGGLRYEHTSSHTTTQAIDTAYHYHGFFPSLNLSYQKDKWSVSLSYSRRITRPAFSDINPSRYYMDSLEYSQGNPLLRPMYSNNIELNAAFHDFNLMVGYTQDRDYMVSTDINDPVNPDILKWTSINVARTRSLIVGLTFAHTWKFYTASYELYFTKPFNKIPFVGGTLSIHQPQWYGHIENTFNVTKNFTLNCALYWNSAGQDGIDQLYASWNVTAGAQWKLAKDRLVLSLYANDIFRTAHYNWWEDRIGNIVTGMRGNMDTRYIMFGIRWNFNNKVRSNVQQNQSNADELGRL